LKTSKRILSIILACLLICAAFAGCSKQESQLAEEITAKTMIIAYTEENAPFIFTDDAGNLTGFEVELIKNTFDSFKGEYKDYAFVKVNEGHVLGEDTAYTDKDGNEFTALIMCGGLQKNIGTNNKDYNWSKNIIENDMITVVKKDSSVKNYNDLTDVPAAVVSDSAQTALNKNAAIKDRLSAVTPYDNAADALAALEKGIVNAVIIDSFTYYEYCASTSVTDYYTILNGVLDTTEYGFGFSSKNDYSGGFNEAVKEMLSPDYGEGDTLTPIIESYFSSKEVCAFTLDEQE